MSVATLCDAIHSHLSASTLCSVPAWIMTCQCLRSSAIHPSSSGHILFHQVSLSQLWSASISLSIYHHLQYISRGIIFISPLHVSKPSQPLLSEEFRHPPDVYISQMIYSLIFPLAHRNMRISVCNFLFSFFLTAQHSAPYTMADFIAVHIPVNSETSFVCVCHYVFVICCCCWGSFTSLLVDGIVLFLSLRFQTMLNAQKVC